MGWVIAGDPRKSAVSRYCVDERMLSGQFIILGKRGRRQRGQRTQPRHHVQSPPADRYRDAEPNATPAVSTKVAHGTETILLVEGDTAVRELVVRLLCDCGAQPHGSR